MRPRIIDAHAHCGRIDNFPPQDLPDYLSHLGRSGITGAVMFSPVMEIYDRYDSNFRDNPEWRRRRSDSNKYLLHASAPDFEVYPFFFIWNDFAVEQLSPGHRGIKWHRHAEEPTYEYDSPKCAAALDEIRRRNMPVVLEEEFENTLRFINQLAPDLKIIIPHLGMLNGGYERFRRQEVFARPNIYADTALAFAGDIKDYVARYGHERLMFGSDFPFGNPASELMKVQRLSLTEEQRDAIIGENIAGLLAESK